MNKESLKNLLKELEGLENALPKNETLGMAERIIQDKYKDVTSKVKEDSSIQFLDAINTKLDKFKETFKLAPIIEAIEKIQSDFKQSQESVASEFQRSFEQSQLTRTELESLIKNTKDDLEGMTAKEMKALLVKIDSLDSLLSFQDSNSKNQGQTLKSIITDFETKIGKLTSDFKASSDSSLLKNTDSDNRFKASDSSIKRLEEELKKLRKDIFARLSNLGGGNANRNIAVGGNTSVLSRYTDINIKAGSNVTITYANNDVTKYLDLTFASTGGSVGGVTRSIATTTVSSTIGEVSGTDYVVIANAGVQLTLPTAVGNQNLYTIKNTGTSSVLVATTGGETIDDGPNALLSIQYTSIDLISDSINWKVT